MSGRFERHARTVTGLTFASRVAGLARDAVLSRVFGAGAAMDAFAFGFMVPNLFRRLFGEGALTASFLPAYTRLVDGDPAAARRLATLVVGGAGAILAGLVLLGEALAWGLSASGAVEPLPARLLMIMLPYAPLICATALLGAMLQARHRFGPTAAAPILLNLAVVGGALLAPELATPGSWSADQGIPIVAGAVLVAGGAQVIWSWWALRRASIGEVAPRNDRSDAAARREARGVVRRALPMVVGLGVLQLNTLLDGLIASWPTAVGPTILGIDYPLGTGSMATLAWAQRLYEFPLGVFGIAVATAIFPALARLAGDPADFAATLRRGVRLVLFIGLPASAGLVLVAEPLVAVVLEGRAFTGEDTTATARILVAYGTAVWAYSLNQVLVRGCYARGDTRSPVRIGISLVGLNATLNLLLIWTPLGVAGLAASTAICAALQPVLLLRALRREGVAGLVDRGVVTAAWRSAVLTAAMAVVVATVRAALPDPQSWWGAVVVLSACVAAGGAVVAAGAVAWRMPELRWALGRS
jgi:putative peptidoglycan lipid II flippase